MLHPSAQGANPTGIMAPEAVAQLLCKVKELESLARKAPGHLASVPVLHTAVFKDDFTALQAEVALLGSGAMHVADAGRMRAVFYAVELGP